MEFCGLKSFTRTKLFWIGLTITAAAGGYFAYTYGPQAYKVVNIDLKMNKEQALTKAAALAEKYQWKPENYKTAAIFDTDTKTQFFIELECGYKKFLSVLEQKLYEPYLWKVRHFKEKETEETLVSFTPEGTPYDFLVKIPEDKVLPNISSKEALHLAQEKATQDWSVDFSEYTFLEKIKTEMPNGRIDRSFIFQRDNEKLGGEGAYRIKLTVSGDTLTEVNHLVHIPESFTRRYQEMRSSNTGIATAGNLIYLILYLLVGGIIGSFILIKKRWFLSKQAFYWALFLSVLYTAMQLNNFPLLWMNYNTSIALSSFTLSFITSLVFSFLQIFFILFITISSAESLGRYAFPHHVQFWKLASGNIPASQSVYGQLFSGYLASIAGVGFAIAMYLFLVSYCGWWGPAGSLVDPNILATYVPWLNPFALSLFAGFREECAFRAIPLAGAALFGRKINREKLCIGIMIIAQAVIFAAAHANYPMQPSYFRIVEMLPMYITWGIIYLTFGLLPVIIMHWLYDLILMSLPLFASEAPGMLIHQSMIIFLGCAPLIYATLKRYLLGHWFSLSNEDFNKGWKPPLAPSINIPKRETFLFTRFSKKLKKLIILCGLVGMGLWINFEKFDYPFTITDSKEQALSVAKTYLEKHNPEFLKDASFVESIALTDSTQQKFVWQENKEMNQTLYDRHYLLQPTWIVRSVHRNGSLDEKAEEYQFFIHNSEITRTAHKLPENKPGETLSKEAAREMIMEQLHNHRVTKENLKEISAESKKQPERLDWTFVFEDTSLPLTKGTARIKFIIGGDEIIDVQKHIHIPEAWTRLEEQKTMHRSIAIQLCFFIIIVLSMFAGAVAFPSFMNRFSAKQFVVYFTIIFGSSLLYIINMFPQMMFMLNTAEPITTQLFTYYSGMMIQTVMSSLFGTIVLCMVLSYKHIQRLKQIKMIPFYGSIIGILLYGVVAASSYFAPSCLPFNASYDAFPHYSSLVSLATLFSVRFIRYASFALLFGILFQNLAKKSRAFSLISYLLVFISGFAFLGFFEIQDMSNFIMQGVIIGTVLSFCFAFIFIKDLTLIPFSVGAIMIMQLVHQGILNIFPHSLLVHGIVFIYMLLVLYIWNKEQQKIAQ